MILTRDNIFEMIRAALQQHPDYCKPGSYQRLCIYLCKRDLAKYQDMMCDRLIEINKALPADYKPPTHILGYEIVTNSLIPEHTFYIK